MENMIINGKPKLTGLKVLVIDDSKTIRRTAETLLTKEGCEVFTAVDGFDALSKIADHQPDIVFVDIMMPRLDGTRLVRSSSTTRYSSKSRSSCCRARTDCSIAPAAASWARSTI
jgi:twitching motility two-component system response regulator PilG